MFLPPQDAYEEIVAVVNLVGVRLACTLTIEHHLINGQRELRVRVQERPARVTEEDAVSADILTVLREAGHRLTAGEIHVTLLSKNQVWSEGHVHAALSRLVKLGVLTNRQNVRPKGYAAADPD